MFRVGQKVRVRFVAHPPISGNIIGINGEEYTVELDETFTIGTWTKVNTVTVKKEFLTVISFNISELKYGQIGKVVGNSSWNGALIFPSDNKYILFQDHRIGSITYKAYQATFDKSVDFEVVLYGTLTAKEV